MPFKISSLAAPELVLFPKARLRPFLVTLTNVMYIFGFQLRKMLSFKIGIGLNAFSTEMLIETLYYLCLPRTELIAIAPKSLFYSMFYPVALCFVAMIYYLGGSLQSSWLKELLPSFAFQSLTLSIPFRPGVISAW